MAATIEWCLGHVDGNARAVGIQTGRKDDLEEEPMLLRLVAAGAQVYPDSRGKIGALPSGPVLMYRPLAAHLWQVETKKAPPAIVAFGITGPDHHARHASTEGMVGCQPWITAFKPLHLGGPIIEGKDPVIADPVVAAAMDTFTNHINSSTGLSDSRDRSTVIEGLSKLRRAGHAFAPDDLLASALARNWRGDAAVELRKVAAEIIAGKNKRFTAQFRPDIVEIWRKEAGGPQQVR